jgi:nucleoside phosphorylase
MAGSNTQFSFAINDLTQAEMEWVQNLMALDSEVEDQRKEIETTLDVRKMFGHGLEHAGWPDFNHSLGDGKFWIYTESGGYTWNAALLVRAFIAKFRPDKIVQFGVAYLSWKPLVDEFSGESYVVTRNSIYGTGDVPDLIVKALQTGKRQTARWRGLELSIRTARRRN